MDQKKKKNYSLELRYNLIPFGYVNSLVFVTKFSYTCTKKNNNNKSFELRYDLIPFGYVGSLTSFAKHSHTKKRKKRKEKQTLIWE